VISRKRTERCYRIYRSLEEAKLIYVGKQWEQWLPWGGCGQRLMETGHKGIFSGDDKALYNKGLGCTGVCVAQNSSNGIGSSQVLVAHTYNPRYLGGWDQEDCGSRPAWANSSQNPISKIIRTKWTGGVAQAVEFLLCKCEALNSNPNPTKNE
jgi:hypothetical protein